MLTIQPPSTPLLRKRQPWLHPFESSVSRYTKRTTRSSTSSHQNVKRSVFVTERAPSDDDKKDKKSQGVLIVPTSSKCFSSLSDLENQTASCLSHGVGIKGISTRDSSKECWVCKCSPTVDEETGKKTYWAGEGCEKIDLSG